MLPPTDAVSQADLRPGRLEIGILLLAMAGLMVHGLVSFLPAAGQGDQVAIGGLVELAWSAGVFIALLSAFHHSRRLLYLGGGLWALVVYTAAFVVDVELSSENVGLLLRGFAMCTAVFLWVARYLDRSPATLRLVSERASAGGT